MGKTCTFFGHRDAPDCIKEKLIDTITQLVLYKNVDCFYVGTHGNFDRLAYSALDALHKKYPFIQYNHVLAYMPSENDYERNGEYSLLPDGIELIIPKFAISFRNKWMIEHSDYVVTFVTHPWGGAAKFKRMAELKNKIVIDLNVE